MLKNLFFICCFLLYGIAHLAAASTYYVSVNGSDSNPGDSSRPFRTIQKAADVVAPGDKVVVRAGTYYERVRMRTSGAPGNPIVFEGETGSAGQWTTIIDASVPLTNWTPDPSIGPGVYKANPAAKAYWLGVSDAAGLHDIVRMNAASHLNHSADDYWCDTLYTKTCVNYWDGFDAMWVGTGTSGYLGGGPNAYKDGANPGSVWVKFRNSDNPNSKNMRVSSSEPVVDLTGINYLTLKNLKLQGAQRQINIINNHDIVVDRCELITGGHHIWLQDVYNVKITNSKIHRNGIDTTTYLPGNWNKYNGETIAYPSPGTVRYLQGVRAHHYNTLKNDANYYYEYAIQAEYNSNAHDIEIAYNEFYDSIGNGIDLKNMYNVSIHDNSMHNMASVPVMPYFNYRNVRIFNNTFYDNNINIRFLGMDEMPSAPKQAYVYNNRMYLSNGLGAQVYWHWEVDNAPAGSHEIYIYHNSMEGGGVGFSVSPYAPAASLLNTFVFNNIISTSGYWTMWASDRVNYGNFGAFSNNWAGFYHPTSIPYAGSNNIIGRSSVWGEAAMPNWAIPANHPEALSAGIDVSRAFVLNGRSLNAMPGFSPGYYHGAAPDLGAILPRLSAPGNLRLSIRAGN